ncbi:hypothetical protein [Haladaptatus cibarius]|uniref:hypothetical protein n=1 Tax=Haladaptatus cibarius TaxID=453847 RepID=UPI00067843E8|nr:hypothetical protein [Haladaptatus cibarius]
MSNTDLKQAVLDSNPSDWQTDGAPDSFTYPTRGITVERIGEWSPASAPWNDRSSGDTLRRAKYRLFHDDAPFDQIDLLDLGDGTLLPMPDYGPPADNPDVMPDEFVLSVNQYEAALGTVASTSNFDMAREQVGVEVRDETF